MRRIFMVVSVFVMKNRLFVVKQGDFDELI